MTETATIANAVGSELSLEELWMPFTANRAFKRAPRLLASASGMHYTSVDGRRILDGTAGLWCVNAGHCREPIVRAVQEAAATLDSTRFEFRSSHYPLPASRLYSGPSPAPST